MAGFLLPGPQFPFLGSATAELKSILDVIALTRAMDQDHRDPGWTGQSWDRSKQAQHQAVPTSTESGQAHGPQPPNQGCLPFPSPPLTALCVAGVTYIHVPGFVCLQEPGVGWHSWAAGLCVEQPRP